MEIMHRKCADMNLEQGKLSSDTCSTLGSDILQAFIHVGASLVVVANGNPLKQKNKAVLPVADQS